jgi:predicted site-specific integrase-resolvase
MFSEISSGIDFDRKEFYILLNDILSYKVNSIYISNKDKLSKLSFKTLENIFLKFGTKIIVINDITNSDNDELLEELLNLIHYFSTKMYSNRKNYIKTNLIKNKKVLKTI